MRDQKPGGGIGLYINQSCQFRERNDLSINVDDIIESQFVELTKPNMLLWELYIDLQMIS